MCIAHGAVFLNREFSIKLMKLVEYLKETRSELKHVSWPTRSQAIAFTITVIAISVGTAIFLGIFDYIFTQLIAKFLI